ncbi:MAG: hypothetical protein ACTSUE_06335 [Promethearchaeota archaeon]
MSSSDNEENWSSHDSDDDEEEDYSDYDKDSTIRRRKSKNNNNGESSSLKGMIDVGTKKLMEKYSLFSGGRTILSQDESKQWTPKMTQILRKTLYQFLTKTSNVMRPLTEDGKEIHVSEPHIVDDCVRFTIEPFFPKIEPCVVSQLDQEIQKYLPGFSFYIGNPGGTHSKKLRLQPAGATKTFSVTVPTESMQPYFEFRPVHFRDRYLMLVLFVLLLFWVVIVVYNFYANYNKEGYSLQTGLYEVFAALSIF